MIPAEKKAMGWHMGVSNLGFDTQANEILKEYGPDWNQVVSHLDRLLQSMAESDEMYDGMMKEVKHWCSPKVQSDKYVKQMWQDDKEQAGLQ